MELKQVKGIGPAKQAKLQEAGITDVESLARCDVAEVVEATGFSDKTVREYKERATAMLLLQDIKGVGPATIETLASAGVRSLRELYEASAERLAAELKVAQERVRQWQAEAEKLAQRVAEESKTPEGRQRLLAEGKEAARVAYQRGQEATAALVERLRQDGERMLQKAQELRETAPERAKEYRAKAEELLARADEMRRELELKARELGEKAGARIQEVQVKVKAETEKMKAANEGLLARIRAKFSRPKEPVLPPQ